MLFRSDEAKNVVDKEFRAPLTVAGVAASVGVHPVHLAREFRKAYRSTVGEYIRRRRITFACREILRSDTPLTEIAMAAGFSDQSHFSRTFKRLTGKTPSLYRLDSRLKRW